MSLTFDQLVNIMAKLRGPGGCPWDHEQTHESIVPQLVEETYEVIGAIDEKNMRHLCEELGDLLLHIVFHAQMAAEKDDFTMEDVIRGISEKLVRRHPHVFADTKVKDAAEVKKNWDLIKADEKKHHTGASLLDEVPKSLPALLQASKLGKKASKAGFDWKIIDDALLKLGEELDEIKRACKNSDQNNMREEFGDLLFSICNICRFLHINPEEALRTTNNKFRRRFATIEDQLKKNHQSMQDKTLPELDALWEEAKKF